jgi:glycine dehydrogenase
LIYLKFSENEIVEYYQKLGNQNLSPDDGIYPLGSCTMKYNPEINDWAAGLEGFTDTHPQAPLSDVQGNLEILFEIQEWFKKLLVCLL